jgi:hypothetical protein
MKKLIRVAQNANDCVTNPYGVSNECIGKQHSADFTVIQINCCLPLQMSHNHISLNVYYNGRIDEKCIEIEFSIPF